MHSRVLALFVSLMLLLSGAIVTAPVSTAPQQHPLAVLAAIDGQTGELPASEPAGHDQGETLPDIPDQLEVTSTLHGVALRAGRMEPQLAAGPTHPHLEGPQRPPRA